MMLYFYFSFLVVSFLCYVIWDLRIKEYIDNDSDMQKARELAKKYNLGKKPIPLSTKLAGILFFILIFVPILRLGFIILFLESLDEEKVGESCEKPIEEYLDWVHEKTSNAEKKEKENEI